MLFKLFDAILQQIRRKQIEQNPKATNEDGRKKMPMEKFEKKKKKTPSN